MKSEASNAVSVYYNTISIPYVRTSLLMLAGGMFLSTFQGCSLFQESPGTETGIPQTQVLEAPTPVSFSQTITVTDTSHPLTLQESAKENEQVPVVENTSPQITPPDKLAISATKPSMATVIESAEVIPPPDSNPAISEVQPESEPTPAKVSNVLASSATSTLPDTVEESSQNQTIIEELNSAPAPAAGQAITTMPSGNTEQDAKTVAALNQATNPKREAKSSLQNLLKELEQPAKPDQVLGTYGIWELRRTWKGNDSGCRLSTHTIQVEDDRFTSQIWVSVQPQQLILNASSEIHLDANGSGVRLDKGRLIPFTGQAIPSHAVLSDDLINRLAKSQKLHLYVMIGDLQSKVTHTEINLKDLRAAVDAFNKCRG